jgi:hypothetical protein
MKIRFMLVCFLMLSFVLMPLMPCSEATTHYKRFSNKIFYSSLDKDMVVVGPSDNNTLSQYSNYEMSFFRTRGHYNFTVRYNQTPIAYKDGDLPAILFKFYVNDTQFTINVIRSNLTGNTTPIEYITIHYIAQGGFIPLPDVTPHLPDENPFAGAFAGLSDTDLMQLVAVTIMLIFCLLPLIGFSIKRIKEHRTISFKKGTGNDYYRSNIDAQTQTGR